MFTLRQADLCPGGGEELYGPCCADVTTQAEAILVESAVQSEALQDGRVLLQHRRQLRQRQVDVLHRKRVQVGNLWSL